MLLFPLVVNAAYAVFYAYVVWFDYVVITPELAVMPVKGVYASKLIWLTMVNLVCSRCKSRIEGICLQFIQLAYHSIGALLAKGARSYGEKKISIRLFHFIASAIVFPIAWVRLDRAFVLSELLPAFLDRGAALLGPLLLRS